MAETRKKFGQDFKEGTVRIVRVAREPGICSAARESFAAKDRRQRGGGDGRLCEGDRAELALLRQGNAMLAVERSRLLGSPLGERGDEPVSVRIGRHCPGGAE